MNQIGVPEEDRDLEAPAREPREEPPDSSDTWQEFELGSVLDGLPRLKRARESGDVQFGIDARTGVPDKRLVLSRGALAEIDRTYPGAKKLHFLDIAHMSVPNKFGLGNAVDELVSLIGRLAHELIIPRFGVMARIGGDEFVFILEDSLKAQSQMDLFRGELTRAARSLFDDATVDSRLLGKKGKDPLIDRPMAEADARRKLREAKGFAAFRQTLRGLRAEYIDAAKAAGEVPNEEGLKAWLAEHEGVMADDGRKAEWMLEDAATKRLASTPAGSVRLCEPDFQGVTLGEEPLTPELVARAVAGASSSLHAQKMRLPEDPESEAEPAATLSDNQLYEIAEHERQEKDYGRITAERENLRREMLLYPESAESHLVDFNRAEYRLMALRVLDASSGAPGREKFTEIPWKQGAPRVHLMEIELRHFGAVNNTLGYAVGDACLKRAFETLRSELPRDVRIARGRGGSFLLASFADVDRSVLRSACDRATAALKQGVLDVHERANLLRLESIERDALQRRVQPTDGLPAGSVCVGKERTVRRDELPAGIIHLQDALVYARL